MDSQCLSFPETGYDQMSSVTQYHLIICMVKIKTKLPTDI